ncbi:hypothetical protein CASFOL_021432 [Castilleja foliolosa]|uniref:Tyrosine-protein kinase catalytic domain-containing protein n=1 Tax=Castilleja foliolosa TaxID=1961234 RepID=A0ABD3CWI6_9LAMI
MCRSKAENQAGPSNDGENQAGPFIDDGGGVVISTITIDDLRTGTRSFNEQIGEGESGHVFKGTLTINGKEQSVAVKRLIRARKAGEAALDWETRMKIGAGVAKGLSYLNYEIEPPVIYTAYLKSSNVLLGVGYHPKISDFCSAVSVFGPEDVNHKADVFRFGVLLREIITGEAGIDWVTLTENFYRVPDREMRGRYQMSECVKAMTLVNRCLQSHRGTRPDMTVVELAMRNLAGEPDAVWPEVLDHQVAAEEA